MLGNALKEGAFPLGYLDVLQLYCGLEVEVTSLEIPSIDGLARQLVVMKDDLGPLSQMLLWEEKCDHGRSAHPHLQGCLSAPSCLIADTPCIWGSPNPWGQVWPAQREHARGWGGGISASPGC